MATTEHEPTRLVGGRAFVRTYDHPAYADPWRAVEDYQRVRDFQAQHPDMGSAAVASRLDLPRGRIRRWMEGSRPDCLRGLQTADDHGWITLDPRSDVFRGLNALLAWIASGGSIEREWYVPSWTIRNEADHELLDRAAEYAGTELDFVRGRSEGRAMELKPVQDGAVLGRVLTVLGAPRGEKNAQNPTTLPDYLADAPERIAQEFVQVYVHNRGHVRADTDRIRFREERPRAYLEALARLLRWLTGERVAVSEKNVVISAAAAREMAVWDPLLDVGD
jgi:hypothetical protein